MAETGPPAPRDASISILSSLQENNIIGHSDRWLWRARTIIRNSYGMCMKRKP